MMTSEKSRIHFDYTINISTIISILVLTATCARYAFEAISYLKSIDNKVAIMWIDFAHTHPDAAKQLEALERKD